VDPLLECFQDAIAANLVGRPTWEGDARGCGQMLRRTAAGMPGYLMIAAAHVERVLAGPHPQRRAEVRKALEACARLLVEGEPEHRVAGESPQALPHDLPPNRHP
jgi:hypothetical protein